MQEGNTSKNGASSDFGTQNPLKDFQISGNTTSKTSKEFGAKIVLQCEQIINSGYFSERNTRFSLNRAMYTGRMNITKFMDFFNVNGKTNYVNINWKSIMIVNTIVSRLVGRWMTKKQKAAVTAVDPISIKQKKKNVDDAEFYMLNKDNLQELGEMAGENFIPQDQFIPDDKDHLDLWAEEEQMIPEEILCEKGINTVFDDNGWGDMGVNTRKIKIDASVVGLIGTEVYADRNGRIHMDYCVPENIFHSYSERDDFSDANIKGVIVSYKISQIRDMYPKLKTEELYEIAKLSKQWNNSNKINYDTGWSNSMFLPFDDWNVDCVRFTLNTLDVDKTLIKVSKDGSMYIDKPKQRITDVYPSNEYIEKTIWNVYRGVYVRGNKQILEWGLEKNMIRPQSYQKIGETYSPFSFYMFQNDKMRNLAIPEKIEEPVEQMILARLKIQQLVAKMRPAGYEYDIDGLQEMDLGQGKLTPLELQKVTDQTGNIYKRSKDAEGNRIDSPIKEIANAGSVPQLNALIELYNYHLQVVRDEIGSNEFAEGQTIKPRVGVQNVQTSMETSFNATDYINDATIFLMDESASKVVCLLHDSIEFGSKEYREIMNEKDVKGRDFKVKIEMLPTIDEINELDATVNNAVNSQPDLVLYLNPQKIKRIARKNVKLAELYFRQSQKRAIEGRAKQAQRQIEDNGKVQQQSAVAAEEEKRKTMEQEISIKAQMEASLSQARIKEVMVTGIFSILSKGIPVPQEWKAVEQEIITNIALPIFVQNQQASQSMQQEEEMMMQEQEQAQQEGMPEEMPEEMPQQMM